MPIQGNFEETSPALFVTEDVSRVRGMETVDREIGESVSTSAGCGLVAARSDETLNGSNDPYPELHEPSSYAIVPGYLSCTSAEYPDEEWGARESSSSSENITVYATMRSDDYAFFGSTWVRCLYFQFGPFWED